MARYSRVYLLTAFVEHLLSQGVRSEERYAGDASRYLRHLVEAAGDEGLAAYVARYGAGTPTARQVERRLRRFLAFARERLGVAPPKSRN